MFSAASGQLAFSALPGAGALGTVLPSLAALMPDVLFSVCMLWVLPGEMGARVGGTHYLTEY